MKTWNINAVRIPLNENCWLNVNCGTIPYCGTSYQTVIQNFVNIVTTSGMVAILDLHWSAPGTAKALHQDPMPNADHTPNFWTGVANAFKNNTAVVFDLFNEPFPDSNQNTTKAWTCLRVRKSALIVTFLS
jgi:aryl-phospho-beta-D-glucosidase BglC (GH1 family)